jgi:hypothetical protein
VICSHGSVSILFLTAHNAAATGRQENIHCAKCVVVSFWPFTLARAGDIEDVDLVLVDEIRN